MKPLKKTHIAPSLGPGSSRLVIGLLTVTLLVILACLFSKRTNYPVDLAVAPAVDAEGTPLTATRISSPTWISSPRNHQKLAPQQTPQEIVADKVIKFARIRRDLVQAMAKRFKVEVSPDVERFFDAVESGRWEEIDAAHEALLLKKTDLNQPRSDDLHQIWRPIQEAWGAAREAHNWPAQTLLDYGNAILDSLRPGTIFAGGTDPGCFIPTMLNDTTEGERHIVLTQNALADGTYLQYLAFLYGDRMTTLTEQDSQRAFQEYLADAQKRLQHDQENPDEPKQIRPGEDVKIVENRVQVSGQVAVMAINEKLFQTLMDKNPETSFAMEESFPFTSIYSNATPLGPIMQIRAQDQADGLTSELATQSVDYWRDRAQQLLSDPETPDGSDPRKAYSKLISSQAGLLQDRKFVAEAEQAFRIANQLCPTSPEAVFRLVNLLLTQNRTADALPIAETAVKASPDNTQFQDLLARLKAQKDQGKVGK